jgi:oligoendopeptidase F
MENDPLVHEVGALENFNKILQAVIPFYNFAERYQKHRSSQELMMQAQKGESNFGDEFATQPQTFDPTVIRFLLESLPNASYLGDDLESRIR